jgi:hypothetical protein
MAELRGFVGSCSAVSCLGINGEYILDEFSADSSYCYWTYAGSSPHTCFAGVLMRIGLSAGNNVPSIFVGSGTSGAPTWQQEYDYCGVSCDAEDVELPLLDAAGSGYCGDSDPVPTCNVTAIYY